MRGGCWRCSARTTCGRAGAKGVGERAVMIQHAARNSLIPTLTVIGLSFWRAPVGRGGHRERLLLARAWALCVSQRNLARLSSHHGRWYRRGDRLCPGEPRGRPRLRVCSIPVSGWGIEIATLRQAPFRPCPRCTGRVAEARATARVAPVASDDRRRALIVFWLLARCWRRCLRRTRRWSRTS